ncbi:2'-5' RNA ligase family protein [Hymenobacter sp. M29]|uniref:2'-5' RNA ligase family protein n=1 Tax=Hymenobacter mellowenesis TaxID=3063995 RepID=A0ABT9AE63_9BACT|nr:2'-5' RNA ligase family protein [Hymenobacter sp. M29]MDO7848138.1 2'-5' RNA ligase family protein [Hymenobacter sp. M29]
MSINPNGKLRAEHAHPAPVYPALLRHKVADTPHPDAENERTSPMLAITSLLSPPHTLRINNIIKSLEEKFGLDDVQATLDPHLTYQLAGVKKLESLKEVLADVAARTAPFPAFTTGLGVFPGERPVIYIPVLRSDALNALHRRIQAATAPLCLRTDKFSGPDCWLPHISLALHDTTADLLGPVLAYLNQETYNLKLIIDNLAILRQEGELFVREEVFKMGEKVLG